jgi:transcriptional regulator GlxA family with amidase domain
MLQGPVNAAREKQLRIGFLLAKDFTMSPFALFVDTLRLASDEGDRSGKVHCDWDVLSATGHMVRSSSGIEVAPTARLGDPARYTHIAVVGGLLRDRNPLDREAIEYLHRAANARIPLIGICTGAFILARCGLMGKRTSCVSWFHLHDFQEEFPDLGVVADRLFLIDGDRISCPGGAGAADLAASLVEKCLGTSVMLKVLQVLQIERIRGAADPQPRAPLGIQTTHRKLLRALQIMEQHQAQPLKITDVARRLHATTRSLERIFAEALAETPAHVYLKIRLETARRLIVETDQRILDIAIATGFNQHATFTRSFRKEFGETPTVYRARMAAGGVMGGTVSTGTVIS